MANKGAQGGEICHESRCSNAAVTKCERCSKSICESHKTIIKEGLGSEDRTRPDLDKDVISCKKCSMKNTKMKIIVGVVVVLVVVIIVGIVLAF